MASHDALGIDSTAPPFHHFRNIQRLGQERRGGSGAHARHQLYVARDKRTSTGVLIKVTSKPGLVYERDIANEIASLSTLNREVPNSRYFPFVHDHGRLGDGRMYLVASLFDELPLATVIGAGRVAGKLVAHLRATIEVSKALEELHGLGIVHVDLNPMNVLYRTERDRPIIRIVDFESSYEAARHAAGEFYSPPMTPGFSAPEVASRAPDVRSDLFSLGAVLYTLLAGFGWTWNGAASDAVEKDHELDPDLRDILLRAVDPDPGRRYASIREFRMALATHLEAIWPGRSW